MHFYELRLQITTDYAEIMIAELADIGFESFTEAPDGINAYIPAIEYSEVAIQDIFRRYENQVIFSYDIISMEKVNWNEEWEKNYQPILVGNLCVVRASFHPSMGLPYEIIINPKMSFGTGHHETTAMMLEHQLEIDQQGKKVMDVGCGTGILAIMAALRGASMVRAFDIDDWSVDNALENIALNNCPAITVKQGTIQTELPDKYEVVLANINRNILLRDVPLYTGFMLPKAMLLVSGFYEQDIADIEEIATEVGLCKINQKIKNNWASILFQKI